MVLMALAINCTLILKSGRASKNFESTLGYLGTRQTKGCRSHAQRASSQQQSGA